jgi:hypothetical protein
VATLAGHLLVLLSYIEMQWLVAEGRRWLQYCRGAGDFAAGAGARARVVVGVAAMDVDMAGVCMAPGFLLAQLLALALLSVSISCS